MAAQPSSKEISAFIEVTQAPQDVAVKWLRESNNQAEAVNAYYENLYNPTPQINTEWDENAFHTDKTVYGPENQTQRSFNVHSQDTLNPAVFDGTISRPPSRISNRAFANSNSLPSQNQQLTSAEQEHQNIQKALAMSISETMPGQEVGVTDATGAHFGPATEAYYDNDKWAMTAARTNAQEILQNPDPRFRMREKGAPAFLKPSPAGHYIPALVTILHAIPMAREALLSRDYVLSDYGKSDEWWDGLPIESPQIFNLDQNIDELDREEIVFEFQRLMAFLDETERAYGSADVLVNMDGVRHVHTSDVETRLLQVWSESVARAMPDYEMRTVFDTSACKELNDRTIYALDLPIDNVSLESGSTLYDALDDAIWTGFKASDDEEIYLEKVPDVLVIKARRSGGRGTGLGVKIPATWYADRYLKESVAATKEMRLMKESVTNEINKIEHSQANLAKFQVSHADAKLIDTTKLLRVAKTHFETSTGSQIPKESVQNGISEASDSASGLSSYSKIAEQLQVVAERVSQKLKGTSKLPALEQSKDQAVEKMRQLSKLYTKPSENMDDPPHHKYTLRGVSTNPNTTYLLANPNGPGDLMGLELDEWQWWKISYSVGDVHPISYSKVREVEVLKAAKDESYKALLVYASVKALSYQEQRIPDQLINFVRADNLAFETELSKSVPKPTTPTKRKAASSYDDAPGMDEINWGGYQDSSPVLKNLPMAPPPPYPRNKSSPQLHRSSAVHNSIQPLVDYDESMPLSPQMPESTMDPKDMEYDDIDLLGDEDNDRVMEERREGLGVVPGGTGLGVGEYALGSYKPEIPMSDFEDDGNGTSE
ncbi:hypothetical protein MMC17_001869 [Xylographa soralifera]|nr:hypothetical protein [Xylographa soralifera]